MECQEILEDCLPLSTVPMYPAYSLVLFEGTSYWSLDYEGKERRVGKKQSRLKIGISSRVLIANKTQSYLA